MKVLICSTNQWTGFYMITSSVMKGLRQIEHWVKNGPITRNRVLPVTTLFLLKIWFSLRTSYKYLFWCTNDLNVHIHTFCKRWSFIWGWFFPVSIFKIVLAASTLWQNSSKTRLPQKNICGGVHSYCNWNFKIYIWKLKIKAVYTM